MNLSIKKKMEGTLKTNSSERESITNLFKYVVRDQKKEYNNLKKQLHNVNSENVNLKKLVE